MGGLLITKSFVGVHGLMSPSFFSMVRLELGCRGYGRASYVCVCMCVYVCVCVCVYVCMVTFGAGAVFFLWRERKEGGREGRKEGRREVIDL